MEGELCKWTNYWNGWQSRWFILDNGVLSYYKSFEEVEQGCKGSIKVSACEISVHPRDNTRLDLSIPGQQHMYVRARTHKERQQWLIALGSAKAGINVDGIATTAATAATAAASMQRRASDASLCGSVLSQDPSEIEAKRTELRLYCDALMQQVHSVKTSVDGSGGQVDLDLLNEGSYLLGRTCDTFIQTLDQLMVMVADTSRGSSSTGNGTTTNNNNNVKVHVSKMSGSMDRVIAPTSSSHHPTQPPLRHQQQQQQQPQQQNGFRSIFKSDFDEEDDDHIRNGDSTSYLVPFSPAFPKPPSLLTAAFLDAAESAASIFVLLGDSAFAPIQNDVRAHLQRLRTRHAADRRAMGDLRRILAADAEAGVAASLQSATSAVAWLARSIKFIHRFLDLFLETCLGSKATGEGSSSSSAPLPPSSPSLPSVEFCLARAYEETLSRHHDIVVRSVYSVTMKQSPTRTSFLRSLGLTKAASATKQEEIGFVRDQMTPALREYLSGMKACLREIEKALMEEK